MARDYFDESKKKKTTQKAATKTKSQSSSVSKTKTTTSKVNKTASKSTFLGGGASTQKVQKATTNNKPKTVKTQPTKQERINQKMYGSTTAPERRTKTTTSNTQRTANRDANLNLKQTVAQTSRTRTAAAESQRRTAQQQKMTAGVDAAKARAQTREIGKEIRRSVTDSLSADNRAFAQRQKSGTLTEADNKRIKQASERRAQIVKNTGAVAKKAVKDTGSGYAQTLYDLTELTASNKNGTQAKAMKMGLDLNRDKKQIAELERERKYTAEESKRRRDELFKKQEQRQAEWDERTKNAKGLEKAWYGAVESGTGMVADTLVGAATGTGQFGALASMGLRTYGSSANQARKEGATDKEARLYGLAQSAKEMGTELMFQGAGLAKAAYGKTGLSLADKSANILTRGLTGLKADAVGAGVRALGGTAEENIEELAGWMADPLIKELTYGKAVRNRMKENLRSNIPQIGSDADAANVASYFSTPKFTDDLTKEYVKSGLSKDKASELAAEMRDYYVAYYSGDKGKLDALETDLAAKLSGQDKLSFKSWSMDELKDTFASTTLLTLATGIPGAVNSSVKGNRIFDSDEVKAVFGDDAVRKVADAVKNTSNKEMSLKAETMKDRLDSGKDLTGTQKFDLYQGYLEKVNETTKKARASYGVVENAREEQDLVPTMGMDRAGNTVYAKETQKEYNEKFASTELTVEAIKNYMESDNSISDDESRRANAVKKAVADLHVGGLTVGDVHEFAYGNELAREALKAEEGIDLNRYIVRDSNGNVDLAATNEATENALFEINAANAIKAAQAETEVYIDDTRGNIDKDLLTRFGNNGQAVWKEVNKDLDPRNLQEYLTTANAASYFYSAGRNTDMSVDSAIDRYADTFKTVDNTVLKRAFAAGARDRIIANTPGYGQTVESGSNIQLKKTEPIVTGQLIMDDDVVLPDSDQSAYLALAMSTNTNIHIVSNLNAMGKDGKPIINQATGLPVQLNGMSHGNDIYLNMNEASEKNLGYVFMHEMTHQIKQYAPNEYLALENLVRDKWFNKDATGMQKAIKDRIDLYSTKGGQQLTEEEAVEEIIADAMAEAMDDPNFAAEVCEQDINLGQEILNSIRAALRSIRQMFASSDMKNERFHNSLLSYLGILDEAEKMWINALATARQNKADGLIADWQEKANKQNAPRLSANEASNETNETRFSLSEPVERVADLIAVHNLNEEDLVGDLSLGGFPMPSIAITKDSMGHDKYGSISLLFHSSTIDPSVTNANQVFGGDAYTPTFPRIHYKANSAVSKKLIDMYYKKSDELGYETMRPMYEYAVTIDDTLDRAGGEKAVIERAKKDIGLKRLFLRLNDKDVEDVTKTTTTSLSDAEVARNDFWINELGKEAIQEAKPSGLRGRDAMHHFAEWRDERIEDLKKSYEKLCREVYGFDDEAIQTAMSDEKAVKKEISSNIIAAINYMKNGKDTVKTEIDYDATWELVEDAAKENGYDAWVDDLFKGIEEKSGIRNDKDLYTPAGNMRSWESLHEPVTLDNVVKQMKKELDSGGGTFLGNNPVGAAQKKYRSLDEIRADEDRLQYLDDENYGKLREVATAKLSKVSHEIYENSPKRQNSFAMFGAIDVGSDIAEALNKTRNKDKLKKILEKDYSYNVSDQNMDDLMDALHDLANLPTGYFEAKPKRAVWFDEVKAAIVPKEFPDHLKAQLSNYGTSIYEYDPEVDGDRTQKINDAASENDLRFSISANLDEPYMDAVNSGNMDEAQRLVDEAAKMAGYTERVYHGTGANFTVFDINKSGNNHGGYSMFGKGFYFSDSEAVANAWGKDRKLMHTFIRLENPYVASDDITEGPLFDAFTELRNKWGFPKKDTLDGILAFETLNEQYGYDYTTELLKENGYDGVIYTHPESKTKAKKEGSKAGTKEYVVFDADNIKSADPVTYDIGYKENGNRTKSVIPLSERFDPTNNDIRYSLPTQDSDGKILTDGQMEYFKNSQARDRQGRLVKVYHTTNMGGFTIFDPSYSDDNRSLFFASNWYVSQTYGRNANKPIDVYNDINSASTNTLIDRVNNTTAWNIDRVATEDDFKNEIKRVTLSDDDAKKYGLSKDRVEKSKEYVRTLKDMLERMRSGEDFFYSEYNSIGHSYGANSLIATKQEVIDLIQSYGKGTQGYYSCYLNLENPLVVDAKGANWNRISYDPYGNETAGITVQDAIEQIESADIADYGIKNINVEFEYNDDGFPIAVSYDIGLLGIPNEEHWEWTNYVESDSFEPNVEEYTDNGVLDNAELGIAMWTWVEDKLRNYVSDGMIDMMEQTNIDVNGELHYESFNKTGYDFIRGGNIVDVSEFTDNIDDASGKEYTVNTRDLAEIAENYGHDGVIIRNLMDIGGASSLKGGQALSDIYIAFSSNQVKDINNENPTENPDIRYSITPEDEAMSHMAHDYAYDTSYEALAYYEDLIAADASTETTYEKAKNYIAKDVDEFYAGLTRYADGMKFDDPVLEEGRTRMARSKQDYFNSNVAKWNDAWLTDGEVLDPKSIKKPVKDLVMAVMSESNTNKKYKTDLVNKAIIDIRLAYYYAKQGRTDVADALLWHSAHRMIDGVEFYADDTSYEEYKGLRDYMKNTRIQLGEEYWSDVDFGAFRKENFGRMNLVKGETNVDKVYAELEDMFPGLFDSEEYDNAPDQLMHMASVLDSVQPYAEAYSSEYCAEWATDIASDLLDIMQNGKELQSIADKYTNKYEARIKAMKARHAEAMLKVRQQRDEGIKREKAKFKEYKEQQREKRAHSKYFDSIQKTHKKLTERLLTNTADKNIPEQYKRDLARLLAAFDLQTVGSKKYEARTGRQGQKTIKMAALKTALTNIENKSHEFHVSDAITDIIDELLGKDAGAGYNRSIEGLTIDELSASELERIDKMLKALLHEFNTYRNVRVGAKRQQVEDIGKAQVDSALEHAKIFGAGRDYQNIPGGIDRIINLDEVTPAYMFRHIDPEKNGLGLMFKELRRSFDKYVRNQAQLNEWMNEIVGKYHKQSKLPWRKYGAGELENWRSENYAQTFNLENGPVTLTPAQMMSLYCLSKRTQAYNHMTGAGIVVAPVSFNAKIMSDLKKKPNKALPVKLTDADIKQIVSQLTPDQIKVADDLQKLMADKMAAWGNEASMDVLGIELFGEPDYFPIKSDKAALETDLNANEFVEAIRNFGFTKAVQPGARNAIMVDDIFNVVTEHCNNMNLYNAYSAAMNDFMKVYNYRDFRDDGSEYTVKQAVAHAYGSKATTFIMTFMRDLNGNVSGRASGIENLYNSLLGNAKKAAVFANLRVAAQQPTAITRAFAVIDPKYLKGIKIENGAMDELFEHCPIALWKSWGYYDINMGKSIEDIMMNNGRWLEDAATELYGALDNVTWTAIWQMVKAEMKDTHPDVKVGSDEYWELCNERMTEIVDLTQVVDSPFHRSHAMRDKGIFVKAATSFMAEPTLTFNMLRDGVIRSREAWRKGAKGEAAKIAARTGAVALLQAAAVAGAASLVDALRKKRPDKDDEDERFLHLWWVNALENFHDELKVWNKIYFVKDIASIFDGWDNSNLALQGIQKFALGYRQLTEDPYARSSATWYENMADGIGYMTGVPVKTVRTGLKNAMTMLGVSVSALDSVGEKLDSVSLKNEDGETGMIGKLLGLVLSDDGDSLLDKYAEKKGYKKVEKSDEDTGSEKTSESGETEEVEKREQLDYDTMLNKALKAAEGYEGEEYNQRIYSSVAQGMKGYIADGDYVSIGMMRTVIEQAGGDVNYFDQRVMEETKSAYKKSLNYDMSYEERWDQKAMYRYMMQHGMSQEELSSEVLYKSDLAKDMKVAYRIGDNDIIYEAMVPLVDAGITETDLERLYENRNRMDLTKYKQNGRYKDKLKSMGTFIWPTDGVITSHFGYRNAPTAGASSNHPAIDIGAPQGTAVVAADGGVIIYAGTNSGYGNSVGIKHDNGMVTYYNHLYAYNVNVGDTVAQGQQIAQVGSTGISTGPHLDFKILDKNGKPVDPEKYLGK